MSLAHLLQQLSDPSALSWKDETYDLIEAQELSPTDRGVYVAKLIEHVQQGDTFAMMTLGHLKASEAVPALEAAAHSKEAWAPTARRALVLLGKGSGVLNELAADATTAPSKMQRVGAILALPKIGGPTAIAALEQALLDPENDVRSIAWDALVEALGLTKRLQGPDGAAQLTTDIEVFSILITSQIAALVKVGVTGMQDIVRRLAAGATPEQLGIFWREREGEDVLDNIRESMFEPDVPYRPEEIATLSGPRRFLAETMIVLRLEHDDERVPGVLVKLGAAWTAPALEAVAKYPATSASFRKKLTDAARALAPVN